jgi:Icc-related predicted phosphoesterase
VALDASSVRIEDVGVFGVSAAPISPLQTPYELDDEELSRRIEHGFGRVTGARVVIFCPHAPPSRTECDRLSSGEHVGSEVIRAFIEREHPQLVLCGHIHEARAMDRIGGSRIVNPGPVADGHYAIVDIDEEGAAVTLDG